MDSRRATCCGGGYSVEDRHLATRGRDRCVQGRAPGGDNAASVHRRQRVGGYDDLRRFLGKRVADPESHQLYAGDRVFVVDGRCWRWRRAIAVSGDALTVRAAEWFISFLDDRACLAEAAERRELLDHVPQLRPAGQRWVPYGYVYPFAEGLAGVLMTAGVLTWLSVPLALFIGVVGGVSVFKAVYVDKRELKCACVGGSSNVPLGFVSLTENVMMVAMAMWMGAMAWA